MSSLSSGTLYEFQVQAVCAITGSYSAPLTFSTLSLLCGTPSGLNATAITTTTATLNWNMLTGSGSYNIQYRKTGTTTWTTTTSTTNSKAITGLTAATSYQFQVQGVCSFTGSYSAAVTFTTLAVCAEPTALTSSAITTSSAMVSWAAVSGAISYNIQYRPIGTTTWTSTTSTTNSKSLTGLSAATAYEFQVQTVCTNMSAFSASANFTTIAICGTPSGLVANAVTWYAANLSWAEVSGATSYNIQYRPVGTATWLTTTSSIAWVSISPLSNDTTYEFQVQAVCIAISEYSAPATFRTMVTPTCDTPTALTATNITIDTATLSWAAVNGATSYNIQYRKTGTTSWTTATSATTTLELTALSVATDYEFQVQAVCLVNSAPSAPANFTTLTPPCDAPTQLNASNITAIAATLSWSATSGATSYNIQYRAAGTTDWTTLTATANQINLTNLLPETNYEYRVQALCIAISDYSAVANFTTLVPPVCEVPSQLTASNVTYQTASLSWFAVNGANSFNIQYRPVGTETWLTETSATAAINLSNLLAETAYEFQVQALCIATSAFSASGNFTTLAAPTCDTPTDLNPVNIAATTATFSWTAVTGATGYNVRYRKINAETWLTSTSSGPMVFISNLSDASDYELQVQAVCLITSAFSASANFTTPAIPTCDTPTDLNAINVTDYTTTLSWTAVTGAMGYNIRYRPTGTANWLDTATTATSVDIANLTASTNYEFQTQAVCLITSAYSESSNFRTLMPIPTCGIATGLAASNITTGSATLSWQEVSGATGYNIQYRKTGTATWINTLSATNTKSLNGLSETTTYEFQVQGICATLNSYSATASFTTLTSGTGFIFAAGTAWKYLDNGTNQGTAWNTTNFDDASWASANGEFGYGDGDETTIINYGTDPNNKYLTTYFRKAFNISNPASYSSLTFELIRDDGAVVYLNGTEIFRNNMPTGTIAYNTPASAGANGSDESTWYPVTINAAQLLAGTNLIAVEIHQQFYDSSDLTFNSRLSGTIPATCGTPMALTATPGSTSAVLNWQAVSGAVTYNVQYRAVGSETWITTSTATNSKAINGLTANSNYEFKVQAICALTGVYSDSATFTTTELSCTAPTAIVVNATTMTTATLSWQAALDAISYNVQYRLTGSSSWTTATTETNTIQIAGLTSATNYDYRIQSVCSFVSSFTAIGNFTTASQTCDAPTNLSVYANGSSSIVLSWDAVSGAASYTVEYQLAGANAWVTATSNTNSKTITGLIASTGYEFRVKTECSIVTSNYSAVLAYTTNAPGSNTLIAAGATWRYLDNGTNQNTVWRSNGYDDSAWKTGNGEFGYGDGDETTIIDYGPNANNKYVTTYFRKSFTVGNPADFSALSLGVIRDDGIVVYLNGTEVYRNNLPTGTIAYNTYAIESLGGSDETTWMTSSISPSLLVAGTNVLSVEIHQQSVASSDMSFNGRLTAPSSTSTPVVVRGAYLQKISPTSITIRWRTDLACNTKVQYGTSLAYGNVATDNAMVNDHIITISGLTPNTKHFYTIGTTTETLQGDTKNNFMTAPVVGSTTPVRIWGIGDFGNGTDHQLNVRNSYMNYTGSTPTNLWIWLGDDAYTNGQDTEFQSRVFQQYPDQFKSMPLFPTLGNHDYADIGYLSTAAAGNNFPYFNIFSLPQNGECGGVPSNSPKYYSYNYANIHFISIDTYGCPTTAGSPIRNWLAADLAANTQRWTVVYMHHPPYTLGTHNSDTELELIHVRQNIVPLLESYKVDLVLAGHSHVNERSYMMKGHLGNSSTFSSSMKVGSNPNTFVKSPPYDGTVYAVCGTSGQDPEAVNQPAYPMAAMYFNNNTNNCSLVIDVNGDSLTCKYLASTGTVVDNFSITKTGSSAKNSVDNDNQVIEKDAMNATINQNIVTLDYKLTQDSEVTAELINIVGEIITTFKIPASQAAGAYNYELPLSGNALAEGLYFVRMSVNGKPMVKKVYVMK